MDTGIIIFIVLLSLIIAVDAIFFALAFACDKIAFGKRADKNPLLKYFTADDFGLTTENVQLKSGKFTLRGYIYRKESVFQKSVTIVFCHGMGPGHIAYTTEIAYFCSLGYSVVAIDSKGCNLSDGNNIGGMYEGVKTAVAAVNYAKTLFPDYKIYLLGHSWGAYSALCASSVVKVNGVVALSAPSVPSNLMNGYISKALPKPFAGLTYVFLSIIYCFKYKGKGNTDAAKCAMANGTPTLLIQGDKDTIVDRWVAAFYAANGENITKYLAGGKAHNPYNTVAAEEKLAELSENLANSRKMSEGQKYRFFDSFNFKAATEEDGEVMNIIAEFINKN